MNDREQEHLVASEMLAARLRVSEDMIAIASQVFTLTKGPRGVRVRVVSQVLFCEGLPIFKAIRAANLAADRMGL